MTLVDAREWGERIGGYDRLVESCDQSGLDRIQIGETLFGTPIYAYDTETEPWGQGRTPVLVAAGAHAEEAAGVATALNLALRPGFTGRMVIVPCRDPLGWDGVRRTFRRAVGRADVPLSTHEQAIRAFTRYAEVVWEDEGFAVCAVDQLAFCSFQEGHSGNADTGEYVQAYLRNRPELAQRVQGLRLLVPGSPGLAEGRDVYDWGGGPTVYVDESGRVGNFNRFFSIQNPPAEIEAIRRLAHQVRSEFVFDLHENFGDRFGMYTNALHPKRSRAVYVAMIDAVREAGFPLMPLDELLPFLDIPESGLIELYPGVYSANRERRLPPDGFGLYLTLLKANSFTTEMGLEQPLGYRADATEVAVRAGLATIERMERDESA